MIQINVGKSDNGNEFLCLNCMYGSRRSGRGREYEVYCGADEFGAGTSEGTIVPFPVTQCSVFRRVDPSEPPHAVRKQMERLAWYIVSSEEGRGTCLIPPAEAKRRDLFYD